MVSRIHKHLTFANVASALALFLVLSGGTAIALSGKNTVFSDDIVNGEVKRADLAPPDNWHDIAPASGTEDLCASQTGAFCSTILLPGTASANFQPFGSGYALPAFYKDQLGIVHLKGVIGPGTGVTFLENSTAYAERIFRLPPAYSPTEIRVFPAVGNEAEDGQDVDIGRIDITPDGIVKLWIDCGSTFCSTTAGYLTLEGISFRPD